MIIFKPGSFLQFIYYYNLTLSWLILAHIIQQVIVFLCKNFVLYKFYTHTLHCMRIFLK